MTDQLPKQFFVWSFNDWDNWGGYARTTNLHPLDDKERETGVLCVPRSQADAMVAAAFEQAQHTAQIAWDWPESEASSAPVCEAIAKLTPADARAAFDRAVREAVEAERERCARIAEPKYKPRKKDCGRGRGLRPTPAGQAVYDEKVRIAAAIRAPQETSE